MDKPCVGCKKQITKRKDGYALKESFWWICKDCAKLVGITNMFSAASYDREKFLKKYVECNASGQAELEKVINVKKHEQELKEEKKRAALLTAQKRRGCKEQSQDKYSCASCGHIWYIGDVDHLKNIFNASIGNFYSINQLKDLSQCPKCGSKATRCKKVKYWVDKNGNCTDIEE